MEEIIKPKTTGGLIRALSGLFITKDNPNGLSNKECTVLAVLLSLIGNQEITKETKILLSNQLNQSLQVTVNYINKFKLKGVIGQDNKLHKILFKKVTIDGADIL